MNQAPVWASGRTEDHFVKTAVLRVFVSLAGVAGLLVGVPSVAHAATGYNRCPPARMCLFSGLNGTGGIAYFQRCSADLGQQGVAREAPSAVGRLDGGGSALCVRFKEPAPARIQVEVVGRSRTSKGDAR